MALAMFCCGLQLQADSTIQFTATSYSALENAGVATLTVQRTNDVDTLVTVDYSSASGTATPVLDYTEVSGTLQFAAGVTHQSLTVPILNDGLFESLETLQVSLHNPSSGAILGARTNTTVRITDNDQRLKLDASTYTANEDAGSAEIGILRGDDGDFPITVDLTTSDGTGIAGVDYVGVTNTIQIAAREILKSVPIPILNDAIPDSSKAFRVTLSNLTGVNPLGSPATATVTITDTDERVQWEFANYYAEEATEFVRLGLTRGESDTAGTVDLQTVDVSATAGLDYVGVTNTLTFGAGERLKLIDIPILNDGLKEANETFQVTLANPTAAARLGSPVSATVTITDNDAGVQFDWPLGWVRETEGTYAVKVLRGNDGQLAAFTVDYSTTNQTARAGQDYTETRGRLAFAEGETFQWLNVPLVCPQPTEPDRKFRILLSNPSVGTALGVNSSQTVRILGTLGTVPHSFEDLTVLLDRSVQFTLSGGVHSRFRHFYDLYPIDVSADLAGWNYLGEMQQTNASPQLLRFTDPGAVNAERRFYRMPNEPTVAGTPPPTGPYSVGVISRLVSDPARRNRYRLSTNGCFMVSVWYPAVPVTGRPRAPLFDLFGPGYVLDPALAGPLYLDAVDRLRYLVGRGILEAEVARAGAPYPVLLFSPGGANSRFSYPQKAEELASHGYVFACVDHADTLAIFPDGRMVSGVGNEAPATSAQERVADLRFIMDQLAAWNRDDPLLAGRMDLERLAVLGFGQGTGTAAEFCRADPRCRAAVLFDNWDGLSNMAEVLRRGLYQPLLTINNSTHADSGLFDKALRDAIWFQLSSTDHANFHDFYWVNFPSNVAGGREAARTMNRWALWFLNKHLKGSADPMPALADYPRVINFKQK